jgi:hypothetical protein
MIKRSIVTALVLFLSYTIFTLWLAPAWWSATQNQWHTNLVKAQNFIYDTSYAENVIVGSSLSCRIAEDSLPGTTNFAFSGQSVFDGLNIVTQKSTIPRIVFIEMNVILRPEMHDFTSALNSPLLFYPRKILPSLRFDKQPLAILGRQLSHYITSKLLFRLNALNNSKKPPITGSEITNRLFTPMLNLQINMYSKKPTEKVISAVFSDLKKYTDQLESKGVQIIFFEMPVHDQLNDLPRAVTVREAFYEHYPVSTYQYIPIPRFMKFETTDGVHLNQSEATTYVHYFKTKFNEMKLSHFLDLRSK